MIDTLSRARYEQSSRVYNLRRYPRFHWKQSLLFLVSWQHLRRKARERKDIALLLIPATF